MRIFTDPIFDSMAWGFIAGAVITCAVVILIEIGIRISRQR